MPKQQKKSPDFEESIARLEEIIRLTDAPVTNLENMISLVEEGHKLILHCRDILHKADLRIQKLTLPPDSQDEESTEDEQTNDELFLS